MKQSDKRLIRKAKRRTRRAKVKTVAEQWWQENTEYILDLKKRLITLEETVAELVKAK